MKRLWWATFGLALLLIMVLTIGCHTYTEDDGTETVGLSETTVATGDKIADTITAAAPEVAALTELAPDPIRIPIRIGLEALLFLIAGWKSLRSMRLTAGARKTAAVIEDKVKHTEAWPDVGPALTKAATDFKYIRPIMPDKA